jgi:Fic family protein
LTPGTITALHAFLSDGLMADASAVGRIRRRAVEIGGSVYLPVALPQRLQDLFDIVIQMAAEIDDPFEQAFFLMVQLPYLQPFEDVNKSVSRLAANIPFSKAATATTIRSQAKAMVVKADLDHFIELVSEELKSLHQGNAVRFGIRPLELSAWQDRQAKRR